MQLIISIGALVIAVLLGGLLYYLKAILFEKFKKDGKTTEFFKLRKTLNLSTYLILGLGWLSVTAYWTVHHYSFYGDAIAVTGEIVKVGDPYPGFLRTGPVLTVKFTDQQNQIVFATVNNSFTKVSYRIGDSLEIFYKLENEKEAKIEDQFWIVWIFLIVGLSLIFGARLVNNSKTGSLTD